MEIIKTNKSPKAIGTYSQAVKVDKYVFTSGQIAIDPLTEEVVCDTIDNEIRQVLANLENVLVEAGSSIHKVIKLNIYLIDLNNFDILNNILLDILNKKQLPARSTVQVSKLPRNVNIEIDAIGEI